ncbi:streptophobe family protein [Streptomyces hawaiiensis]|uniref:streptophobe family protein n=1 Tax=Streptomyces hawaiiensis TaxID=67305 RepID=UPI00365D0432
MSAAAEVGTARDDGRVPWGDVLMSAVAAVSWALIGMAGTAALGLRLLEADTAGSLGPMTAAVVALGAGGSVTPSGDVSAFGLTGTEADAAVEITPLGVSLVGAVLLSWFFLRSLRAAGVVISRAELLARAGAVVALFVAMLGGLAWAGHDVITIDGGSLGPDDVTGGSGGVEIPGLGDVGGLLPDRLGDLVDARAAVGFTVDTAPTLLGGFGWSAGILLIALLASRRTPLPRGWEAVHRVVRPAVSAVVTVLLVAVAAGFAAAASAAIGDDRPGRIAGAALLGAPNGAWLGIPLGLFVPWDGRATGELIRFLPDPLDDLLGGGSGRSVTLGRLAELDGRVWLLGVAAGSMMLLAGVLAAVRTPVGAGENALRFAGRCALRLGVATALALPLLAWLTNVSVTASLSVLGFDAFGAGIELHGHLGLAVLLGAVWGAGAGAVGALLAWECGAAGRGATALARRQGLTPAGGAADLRGTEWAEYGAGAGRGGAGAWRGGAGAGPSEAEAWQGGAGPSEAEAWRGGAGAGPSEAEAWRGGAWAGEMGPWGGRTPAGYDEGSQQAWPGAGAVEPGDDTGGGQAQTWGGPGPARYDEGGRQAWPDADTARPGEDAAAGQTQTRGGPGPTRYDEDARQAWQDADTARPGDDAPAGPDRAGYDRGTGQAWPGDADTQRPGKNAAAGQTQTRGGPGPTRYDEDARQAWPDAGAARPGDDAPVGPDRAGYDRGTGQAWPDAGAGRPGDDAGAGRPGAPGGERRGEAGPYAPGAPYRPPNPGTNPYLRVPEELREPEDARPAGEERLPDGPPVDGAYGEGPQDGEEQRSGAGGRHPGEESWPDRQRPGPGHTPHPGPSPLTGRPQQPGHPTDPGPPQRPDPPPQADRPRPPDDEPPAPGDVYGAPTVVRPVGPPPRGPRQSPGPRNGNGPPPPPPPPPPPRKPRGGR